MKASRMMVFAGVAIFGLVASTQRGASAQDESRPNILIIVTDDQRAFGLDEFLPETMEWLGNKGVRYPNAFASTPLCCPSRASIFSGRYAHNHGVRSNNSDEEAGVEAFDHSTTMQAYLQQAGYRTGIVGKFFNGWALRKSPPFWNSFSIGALTKGYRDRRWSINGNVERISAYSTKFVGHRASVFIRASEANDDRPWMLYVSPAAPHRPWEPERRYENVPIGSWSGNPAVRERDLSDKPPWLQDGRCHLACARIRTGQARLMMSVDDLVLKLKEKLTEFEEANTLVTYVSDNGSLWGEHGRQGKSQPYVQSSSVPMMMRWPANTSPGTVDERFALNIDIAPTVLEAAGVPVGETPMDGRSLLDASPRKRVHLEYWCGHSCDRWASTRTAAYQYVERYDADGNVLFREYYDNLADPWQLTNLLRDGNPNNNPDVAALNARLELDKSCVGGLCP